MKRDRLTIILAGLKATHATLVAAAVQVEAEIIALEAEEQEEDAADGDPKCPKCSRTDVVRCGVTSAGRPEFVCVCGEQFSLEG